MLNQQQRALTEAVLDLDVEMVKQWVTTVNPNFMVDETPLISVFTDQLYDWWDTIHTAYRTQNLMSEVEKQSSVQPYIDILNILIDANVNLHLWDSENGFGPLWDCASAACIPMVQRLLDEKVNPNTIDDEGLTILSSISDLFFACDFDEIDWQSEHAYPEIKQTLMLLRQHGAKMSKELKHE